MPGEGLEIHTLFYFCPSSVHMKIEEKISLTCGRDGGLQNMELHGMIMLHISDEKFARIRLHVENEDKRGVQLQVKPVCVRAVKHAFAVFLSQPSQQTH